MGGCFASVPGEGETWAEPTLIRASRVFQPALPKLWAPGDGLYPTSDSREDAVLEEGLHSAASLPPHSVCAPFRPRGPSLDMEMNTGAWDFGKIEGMGRLSSDPGVGPGSGGGKSLLQSRVSALSPLPI